MLLGWMCNMVFDNYPPAFREACATHEFLRKLGFESENIFLHLNPDGNLMIVLMDQVKLFAIIVGRIDLTLEELTIKWTELLDKIASHEVSNQELDGVWTDSFVFSRKVEAVAALVNKGFILPLDKDVN